MQILTIIGILVAVIILICLYRVARFSSYNYSFKADKDSTISVSRIVEFISWNVVMFGFSISSYIAIHGSAGRFFGIKNINEVSVYLGILVFAVTSTYYVKEVSERKWSLFHCLVSVKILAGLIHFFNHHTPLASLIFLDEYAFFPASLVTTFISLFFKGNIDDISVFINIVLVNYLMLYIYVKINRSLQKVR